jgi:hypothetical protein
VLAGIDVLSPVVAVAALLPGARQAAVAGDVAIPVVVDAQGVGLRQHGKRAGKQDDR